MIGCTPEAFRARDISRHLEKWIGLTPGEAPQRLPSAAETAVWRLHAGSRTYVIKIFPAGQLQAVLTEIELFDYLRERALRTPDPVAGAHGRRIGRLGAGWRALLGRGGCPVLVMPYDHGRPLYPETVKREEMLLVARHIGRMHEALQRYPGRPHVRALERWAPHFGRFDDFLVSANARSFAPREFARLRELDRAMEQRAVAAAASPAGAQSVLHGDLGLHHVRLAREATPADVPPFLFDFSDFSRGPVVADLATLLSQLYCGGPIDLVRWQELRAWLLEGYVATFPLGPGGRRALDDALVERLLVEVRYISRVSLERGRAFSPEGIRKRYRLAAHVLGERQHALDRAAQPAMARRAAGA